MILDIWGRKQYEKYRVYQAQMKYMHIDIGKDVAGFSMFRAKLNKIPKIRSLSPSIIMHGRPEDRKLGGK